METEAKQFIAPSPTMESHERIALYNQQYWWRLLTILQEEFPLLTRLFGYSAFNEEIATPYLLKHTSTHWSLNYLGGKLPQWIAENYDADNKQLILDCTRVDWAFSESFIAGNLPPLSSETATPDTLAALLDTPLALQPHIHLFELPYDLFTWRKELLQETVEFWEDNPLADLPRNQKYYFAFFRRPNNTLAYEALSCGEFQLLDLIQKGSTLSQSCDILEERGGLPYEEAGEHLPSWIQTWLYQGWLSKDG